MASSTPAARICCLDLDTFFVSVERLLDPSLIGKPVVVGGRPGQRGVVTAASYEVRRFGVRSGMAMGEAQRLAPDAIYLPTRHGTYTPYAKQVRAVLDRYTPVVRTASIDEFFLDFSGCERLYRQPDDADDDATIERLLWHIRDTIQEEIGLPSSVGIGATRSIAKIASGRAKPAGVMLVPVGGERAFLSPQPVRRFPGIGPVAERRLHDYDIETIGQLLDMPAGPLRDRFVGIRSRILRSIDGSRAGSLARERPAFLEHDAKGAMVGSISNERTFHADVGDVRQVLDQLSALSERVCWRIRRRDTRARTITLRLRWSDFHTITRSRTIRPTNDEGEVFEVVRELFGRADTRRLPYRLVGVGLSNLAPADRQLELPLRRKARPKVGRAVDEVRSQFGYDAIRLGVAGSNSSWLVQAPGDADATHQNGDGALEHC